MAAAVSLHTRVDLGRYTLHQEFAVGGMASLVLARQKGASGFERTVAIKRLHKHLAREPEFQETFLDEARTVARIRHPNVVPVLDVVIEREQVYLVMEYVHGESLARLLQSDRDARRRMPLPIAAAIMVGVLDGLHAAHEAVDEQGRNLGVVHRDVSPHNVVVGVDGAARVLDFGIAKAAHCSQRTEEGHIKGKVAYMAPEQMEGGEVDRRADVFAAGVILWELLTGRRMVEGSSLLQQMVKTLSEPPMAPSRIVPRLPERLDDLVLRALERDPEFRFATARQMAMALESCVPLASARAVGEYVASAARAALAQRATMLRETERVEVARRKLSLVSIPDIDVHEDLESFHPVTPPATVDLLMPEDTPSEPLLCTRTVRRYRRRRTWGWLALPALVVAAALAIPTANRLERSVRAPASSPSVQPAAGLPQPSAPGANTPGSAAGAAPSVEASAPTGEPSAPAVVASTPAAEAARPVPTRRPRREQRRPRRTGLPPEYE